MWTYLENCENSRPLQKNERAILPHAVLFRNYGVAANVLLAGQNIEELPKMIEYERLIPTLFKNR